MRQYALLWRFLSVCFLITVIFTAPGVAFPAPLGFNQAFDQYKKGNYLDAKKCWLMVWKNHRSELSEKQRIKLFLGLTNTYLKLGDVEQAKRCFTYVKKMAPKSKAVARLQNKIDNSGPATINEAMEDLRYAQLVERSAPGSSKENFARLLLYFRKLIVKKEELVRAHRGLAICLYYTKGTMEEVESNLLAVLSLQPADTKSIFFLSLVEKDRGNFRKELDYLEDARKIGHDTPELYVRLAILSDQLAVVNVVEKVMTIVEHIIPDGLQHVREIYDGVTNVELKEKIGKLIASMEEKQRKAEEQKQKEEEEARRKGMLIVKYFSSDG